jgi:para-aminobenzoate synthetase component 1
VSTIVSTIRPGLTHLDVLESCFPGGSITGAPKIRAMEIIDVLEPVARGPYTGCIGYLGFNRESQFSVTIRTVVLKDQRAWFHVGAGIVADSDAQAEYEETWAKAGGILAALGIPKTPA